MSDCTECGWPVATDADNDRPCDDHCDHCRGLCWHEFTGVHRDDVRPDAAIATLTHRAEVAERSCEDAKRREQEASAKMQAMAQSESNKALRFRVKVAEQSAALWRERCNKAEARVEAMQSSRSLCIEALRGVQATGDVDEQTWDVVADGIRALMAERDALALDKSVILDQLRAADEWCERDANAIAHREFMAAGWRRLARHYQSCHLAGHACLRETHRAKGEQVAALRRARDDDAAYRSDLMEQCDALRAKLARAEGVVAAARAVAREHDRYLSDEVGPMGHVDEACDALRAALATYEEG